MTAVTILLPTHEPNPAHLREALDSIFAQTLTDWELFIHDDASTKDVRAMVEPYLSDARVHFTKSETRLRIGGNWNACMKLGSAPYVQYLFQDDVWEPRYLERAVAVLESNPDVGFVAVNHEYRTDPPGSEMHPIYAEVEGHRRKLTEGRQLSPEFLRWWIGNGLRPNVIGEPSFVMMRRSLVERVGLFREDLKQYLDAEYWVRLLLQSDWYYVAESLGFFRVHGGGASAYNARGMSMFDRPRVLLRLALRHPILVGNALLRSARGTKGDS